MNHNRYQFLIYQINHVQPIGSCDNPYTACFEIQLALKETYCFGNSCSMAQKKIAIAVALMYIYFVISKLKTIHNFCYVSFVQKKMARKVTLLVKAKDVEQNISCLTRCIVCKNCYGYNIMSLKKNKHKLNLKQP